ncbi:MAG: alanine racemase [Pseudomonadota bacterium]|nr:alanine racemase [Pseudomonadota bacterium]
MTLTAPAALPATPVAAGSRAQLTIHLGALADNWRALAAKAPTAEAAAVVKADAYGTGLAHAAPALFAAGARTFFVAQAGEGAALREILGPGPAIYVFNGFMPEDAPAFRGTDLRPVLSSPWQVAAWLAARDDIRPSSGPGLHIESGINRLGFTAAELDRLRADPPEGLDLTLVMSHLANADEPENSMNARQRGAFVGRSELAARIAPNARRSLAATGGTLLGEPFHFDLVRPGVGLYGGEPFAEARPVVTLLAPFLQVREIPVGETVGYGATWTARRPSRIGVLPVGYADGLHRLSTGFDVYVNGRPAPVAGRVSMDMITVDLTDLPEPSPGDFAEILGPNQSVDRLAAASGTTGYEVLTGLGPRYRRSYA